MVNRHRGESAFEIAGERYALRATLGALAEIEDALGIESLAQLQNRFANLRARDILSILKYMSAAGGAEIPADALNNLEVADIETATEAIVSAINQGGTEKNAKAAAKTSPGKR